MMQLHANCGDKMRKNFEEGSINDKNLWQFNQCYQRFMTKKRGDKK